MSRKIGILISLDLDTGRMEVKKPDDPIAALGLIELAKAQIFEELKRESEELEKRAESKIIPVHGIMNKPVKG